MSEEILKALMQLFALISGTESDKLERRKVVFNFLRKQLNKQLTQKYIYFFDQYYDLYQDKYKNQEKLKKHISSSSVRLLVVCEQINKELTQQQKFSLMVLLINFVMTDEDNFDNAQSPNAFSELEQEFVETVANGFNLDRDEFLKTLEFISLPVEQIPKSPYLLLINSEQDFNLAQSPLCKHLYREGIEQLAALHVPSVDMYICRYEGERQMYLNGRLMSSDDVYILNYGCCIRSQNVKPVYYSNIVSCFFHSEKSDSILFEAQNVEYEFDNGKIGLHSTSFEVCSGNIVGIMGGSGAGKSTLLGVLTGLNKPTRGKVLVNNIDINVQGEAIEGLIGYVSQDDLLIEELTVFQNLYFNAKLCFGQYSDNEIEQKTNDVLHDLGLYEIRNMKVGSPLNKKISGGQRKRLNIALELIRQPAVLFLDEPTSGLSSRDSDNIMDLLKELSLKGKLVFVVIHQPSSDIFKMFDRLFVLDNGGYLIYDGDPIDAILYFKSQTNMADKESSECQECGNVNSEQIFNIVGACVLNEHGQVTETRRTSPVEWYETFVSNNKPPQTETKDHCQSGQTQLTERSSLTAADKPRQRNSLVRPSRFKQFLIYAQRNVLSKASDLQYVTICLFEAPLLALLLSYIIRYYNVSDGGYTFEFNENVPIYIFVAVIIAIFIGLSVSAEEIIKDRKILKRESFLHLSRGSYLFSKTLVLFAISAIQAMLFVVVGNYVTGVLNQTLIYWIVIFSAWACANLMGLIISDTFKSVVTIYIIIPFIVIPQLMLSGVLLRFEKINPDISSPASVPWYGEIITARWAFEALAVEQFVNNKYAKIMYPYEKNLSIADFQRNYWLVEMRNKLDKLKKQEQPDPKLLSLICNEIERENKRQDFVQFSFCELSSKGISQNLFDQTNEYFDNLSRYYTVLYNKTTDHRDRLMKEIAEINPDSMLYLKSRYNNLSLGNMVKNSSEDYRLIEYKNQLLQNYHQIYKDPEHPFVKAHFYAPEKQFLGNYYPTIWVNVIVLWCFNIFFFVALYFLWLPRLLGLFQYIYTKTKSSLL